MCAAFSRKTLISRSHANDFLASALVWFVEATWRSTVRLGHFAELTVRIRHHSGAFVLCACLMGCSIIPATGPATSDILNEHGAEAGKGNYNIEVVDLSPAVIRRQRALRTAHAFSETLGTASQCGDTLGVGDVLSVSIWEAPPATLFGGGEAAMSGVPAASQIATLPDQVIDGAGNINVPFAGSIRAAGLTITALEGTIVRRLAGKAHEPQVLVRLARNAASDVTVVGDVVSSTRMPLTPKCERLLDALAAEGGVRQPVDKVMLQVTRGEGAYSMPLDSVIRDPRQNVPLRAGDVITALYQPSSFMAFGATGKNEEIGFEGKGISLAQALARAGGLVDTRADARGVFVFRIEDGRELNDPSAPSNAHAAATKVPVVYRLDLRDPAGMFLAQQFDMNDKDTLYVSNSPVADIQKLANLFYTVVFPAVSVGAQFK